MNAAIIGCGAIAPIHVEALLKSGIKIAALCDIKKERAEALNARYSLSAGIFTDFQSMLDVCSADCVHICTPHYLHASMCVAALEKNINVLCEKPLAVNSKELSGIRAAAKKSKAKLGVCFQNRYLPSNIAVKRFCADKEKIDGYFAVPWFRDNEYYLDSGWRGKKETEGGGTLINQAIHTLDLMLWFMGGVKSVKGACLNLAHEGVIDVEDTAVWHFSFESGGKALFFATTAAPQTHPVEIKLNAGKDSCIAENNVVHINGELSESGEQYHGSGKICWGDGHAALIKDFYDCICRDRKFIIDEYEGAKALELLFKIYEKAGER